MGLVIINEERFQQSWTSNSTTILKRMIIDESMCLRTAGASTVIAVIQLFTHDSFFYNSVTLLESELVSYIDVIIIIIENDDFERSSPCDNIIIPTNSIDNTSQPSFVVPVIYINNEEEEQDYSDATVIKINRANKVMDITTMTVDITTLNTK
jgi:hypothetical protein